MVFKMTVVVVVVVVVMSMLAKDGEGFPNQMNKGESSSGDNPGHGARAQHWDQWHQLHHLHLEQHMEQERQRQLQIEHMRHHQAVEGDAGHGGRARHWDQWRQLWHQHREQQQQQQQRRQMEREHMRHHRAWRIWDAREQQLLREQQLELEQDLREEMEDIIKDNNLEHFAMQMSVDALGSILRPLREIPTYRHGEDCVTRTAPVTFLKLGLGGHFQYIVCSSGDGASMHVHFQELGGTTPSLDTTTPPPAITTTPAADITTPAQPLCPTIPTTTPGDTTTTTPTTTPGDTTTPSF